MPTDQSCMHAGAGHSTSADKQWQTNSKGGTRPCLDKTHLTPETFLDHLKTTDMYDGQVVHIEELPSRAATYGVLEHHLCPQVWQALASKGIAPGCLFTHQVEAIDALLQRQHVAICTSTASGKSLCYNVPILQVRTHQPHRAIGRCVRSLDTALMEAAVCRMHVACAHP
jgi:ATP-dependent helicase YprA (DUF1998 family)